MPAGDKHRQPQPTATVVGPTATELESIKELINFDHIYYKVPSGAYTDSVQEEKPKSVYVSVTVAAEPITVQQQQVATPLVSSSTNQNTKEDIIDLTQPQLDLPMDVNINDLLDMSSWNELMDIDDLLQRDLATTAEVKATTVTNTPVIAPATNISGGVSLISKDSSIATSSKHQKSLISRRKRKAEEPITLETDNFITDHGLLSPSLLSFDSEMSYNNETSGYGSDLSDIGSPKSDISSALSDDLWEESFTELFPSLL